ncbi:hypothetical protein JCM10908_000636 [Rhodotorula pacifica]|uniref:ankyrin repeat domain-containing protein n=1 Tax=Rhodotorula pacifica TaxID=1495444 RepID=UPI00317B2253
MSLFSFSSSQQGASLYSRPSQSDPRPPRRSSSFASSLSSSSRGGSTTTSNATALSRQAARLGIVTAYKDLNLHSAAAKGNIGLVQYALANGQPVNSVLDGVLPIHAAASSGSETVVRMLVEAGADVNSPRLSRRFTREGTKSSGHSVGTQGSTPLHFAAANGHLLILSLLLSYGADPRTPEKHGATAEQMAAQNGFLDAADLLHSYSVKLDQAAAAREDSASLAPSSSRYRPGGGSLRSLGGLRRKSSTTATTKPSMQAQRSLDALATKFAHHAHRASSSSLSVNSIRGLTPLASSSQISLGAAGGLAPLAATPTTAASRRRPSLPGSTMRPLLEVGNDGRVRAATISGGGGRGGPGANPAAQQASMSTVWPTAAAREEDPVEQAERRRSMEVNRPLRQDSFQTGLPTLASLDMSSLQLGTAEGDGGDPDPTPTDPKSASTLPGTSAPVRTLSRPSSQQRFYRPRQSSGLSKGSFTGRRPSMEEEEDEVFHAEDDSPVSPAANDDNLESTAPAKPNRPRAVSNPDSRSPLLQHLHATHVRSPRSRDSSETSPTSAARQATDTLAVPAQTSPWQATSTIDGRARSNSASTDASFTVSTTSSSRDSTWSGPTFSTASTSTAPTTAPPHSPTKRVTKAAALTPTTHDLGYFGAAAASLDLSNRRHLEPLYEAHSPGIVTTTRPPPLRHEEATETSGDEQEPKTRAQARSRVKKAERELMGSLGPAASSSRETTQTLQNKSLKDQLAAYGKSLRAERELVEKEEREKGGGHRHSRSSAPAAGYTIETISISSSAKARSSAPTHASTSRRQTTATDRLLPPSPTTSRRSRSPGSSATATTPNRPSATREHAFPTPAAMAAKARSHMEQVRAASPISTKSGSNKSGSTAEAAAAVTVAPPPTSSEAPVLGQGHGGVSFFGVQPPNRSHHHHHHAHHHHHPGASASTSRNGSRTARSSDRSQSDRDLASVVSSGGSTPNTAPISTRNKVEEERRRREEEEQKVPKAMRTVPGRTGFVRKLFGGKEASGPSR